MYLRGIRGATTVKTNHESEILAATLELLASIVQANPTLQSEDLASALFTLTDDLSAAYPAKAARQLGWVNVPLMCAQEIPVPGALQRCIRVLIHWNTELPQQAVHHVYLKEAACLRPDLALRHPEASEPWRGSDEGMALPKPENSEGLKGCEVSEHPTGCEVSEHPTGCEVSEHPTGCEASEHPTGCEASEHPTGCEASEHPTGCEVSEH